VAVAGRATGRGWRALETTLLAWSEPLPTGAGRRRRLRVALLTWTLAVGLSGIAFGTAPVTYDVHKLGWGLMPFIGLLSGLPFGLVVTRPTLGWLVSAVSAFVLGVVLPLQSADPWRWGVVHALVMFALLFAVALRQPARRVVAAWAGTVLLFWWGTRTDLAAGWMVGVSIITVIGLLIGRLAVTNRALTQQAEETSAEKERRLVLEERSRIARDLHDIVAHHMSLVVVQAETAGYRIPDLPESARDELASISGSARAALAETRALLAVLRQDDDEVARTPQPGLDELAALVDGARRAGQDVAADVRVSGDPPRPGTSLAAYRIVQESLANAARHAPGAPVRVQVVQDGEALTLSVVNARPPGGGFLLATDTAPGEGHGIVGMRERVVAEGGTLEAAPDDEGGFAVRAVLPLTQVVA